MKSQSSSYQIKSACDVNANELETFFKKVYPNRAEFLSKNWYWLNRSDFLNKQTPLVILDNEEVIGQAATIPLRIKIDGNIYQTGWFVDLVVDPQYRGKGLATKLEKNNMKFFKVSLGFPNEKSKPLLEKVGWKESPHSYMHYHLLKPFSTSIIPKFVPNFLRAIFNYCYKLVPLITYNKYIVSNSDIIVEPINKTNGAKFKSLIQYDASSAVPQRDDDFYSWRVTNSPNFNKYRLVFLKSDPNISCIIKLDTKEEYKFVDIMWVSDINRNQSIQTIVSSLGLWALRNNYSYMRMYTSNCPITEQLKKTLKIRVKTPPFIYFINQPELVNRSNEIVWNIDMFDSDFEWQV